jgi:hypothetical protein
MSLEYPDLPPVKLGTQIEKAEGMQWLHKSKCAVKVQRRFCRVFGKEPLTKMAV